MVKQLVHVGTQKTRNLRDVLWRILSFNPPAAVTPQGSLQTAAAELQILQQPLLTRRLFKQLGNCATDLIKLLSHHGKCHMHSKNLWVGNRVLGSFIFLGHSRHQRTANTWYGWQEIHQFFRCLLLRITYFIDQH